MTKTQKILLAVGLPVAAVLAACLGVAVAANDAAESPPALAAATSPAATTSPNPNGWQADSVSPSAAPASTQVSPSARPVAPAWKPASVGDGVWTVGTDMPAGTYRSTGVSSMCYWEITKTGSNGSDIIANDLPSGGHPQVTLKRGQDFGTNDCGTWVQLKK
jgi:hypothetical protein